MITPSHQDRDVEKSAAGRERLFWATLGYLGSGWQAGLLGD